MQTDAGGRPRLVIFDLDGVVYRGAHAVDGAPELIERFRAAGAMVRFATNNSMLLPEEFVARLHALGVPLDPTEIVTSATATVDHLRRHLPAVRSVLVVGEAGLQEILRRAGFRVTPAADAARERADGAPLPGRHDAVVAGLDLHFGFPALAAAQAALLSGARFVATNADAMYPTHDGFLPGAGSMVAAIRVASGVEPLVIGKPEPGMFRSILEQTGVAAAEAIVIGDNPSADIVAARRAGLRSILLLTGVADAATASGLEGERRPDQVVADPRALASRFEAWLS